MGESSSRWRALFFCGLKKTTPTQCRIGVAGVLEYLSAFDKSFAYVAVCRVDNHKVQAFGQPCNVV